MSTIKTTTFFFKTIFFGNSLYSKYGLLAVTVVLLLTKTTLGQTVGNYAKSDPVGNSEVNISVDANGSAVLQLPILLPPGTQGVQPQISLSYNSAAGNGGMGMGWQIQGLSAIQRVGQTIAQDRFISSVNYSGSDRLMLDGQRLILKSGSSYGLTNSKYRTEIETWQKIMCNENMNSSTSAFTVYSPNGITKSYGTNSNSRIFAEGKNKVRLWALNRLEDLHGNYMTISYDNAGDTTGNYYPLEIQYTGNSKTEAATKRSIKFQWENRSDAYNTYVGGSPLTQPKRLAYVRTYVNNVLIKEYHITYEDQNYSNTKRSLVSQITEMDGKGTALPSTTLSWQKGSNVAEADTMWGASKYDVSNNGKAQWMVDVNGDGRQDLVYNRSGKFGYYVMLSNDNSFESEKFWGYRNHSVAYNGNSQWMADLNGDGMADHVYNKDNEDDYYVMLSEADTFAVDTYWGSKGHSVENKGALQWFVDVNGDGMADHVFQREGKDDGDLDYYVRLSTGDSLTSETKWGSISNSIANSGNSQWMVDMNGDGRADHVYIAHSTNATYVMLSEGNTFGTDTYWEVSINDPSPTWFVDMNNDGLTDQVIQTGNQYSVRLNTGTTLNLDYYWGSTTYDSENGVESIWFTDVNGDRLPDLLYQRKGSDYKNEYYVSINTGKSFLADVSWGDKKKDVNENGASQWFADMNGDGMADHIYNKDGNNVYYTMLAKGPIPDLLHTVVSSMGGKTTFTYGKLGDPSVYQAAAPDYDYNTTGQGLTIADVKGGAMYVTKSMQLTNNAADNIQPYNYKYGYFYKGAKIDHSGRGWLGFASKETRDFQLGNKQVEQFNQLFPYTSTPYSTTLQCYNGDDPNCTNNAKLHQQRTDYYCLDGQCSDSDKQKYVTAYEGGSVYQLLKYRDIDRYYTYNDFNYGITNTYQYDNYGNQISTAYLGYTDEEGNDRSPDDNLNYFTDYYNNISSSNWLIGYDTLMKVCSDAQGNQIISSGRTHYDFPAKVSSPSCIAGWQYKGTMDTICMSNWVDKDNAGGINYWITQKTMHDTYGNPTVQIGPANDSIVTEYESVFNTFPKRITLPPNKQGVKMVETYIYDAGFGVETSTTNVTGNTTTSVLDGFGRTVAKTGPNAQKPNSPPETIQKTDYHNSNGIQYISTHKLLAWGGNKYHSINKYYDGLQRVYRKESISDEPVVNVRVDYTFKDPEKQKAESLPYFDHPSSNIYWKTKGYDAYGRVNELIEPFSDENGQKQTVNDIAYFKSDSIKTTTNLPNTDSTYTEVLVMQWYNGKQQVKKLIVPGNNNATTNYEYDLMGRIKYVKDPDGVENTTTWNSLSAKLQFDETNMGTTIYEYYNTGLLKSVTDAKRQQQEYAYDLLNRNTLQTLKDSSGAEVKKVVFTFDVNSSDTANAEGQLSSVKVLLADTTQSAYTYGYSPYGLLNMEELNFGATNYITKMAYSPVGSLTDYMYPDTSVLKISGKISGNLGSLSLKNHNTNHEITAKYSDYNAQAKMGLMTYGNGTTTNYQYMKTGRLRNVQLAKGANTLMQHGFTWNYLKELQHIDDQHADSIDYSQSFTYTNRRLTKAVSATYGTLNYAYSKGGNMTLHGGKNYSYKGHQIDSSLNYLAKYDANGNMTSKTSDGINYSYQYDTQNRLLAVYKNNAPTPEETYVYDYEGKRLKKTNNTSKTTTTYISKDYEKVEGNGNSTTTKYALGLTGTIGSIAVSNNQPVQLQYYHHDQINSTTMVSDAAGNIISHLVYQPYGKLYVAASFGEDNVQFTYEDKELDATGLFYFNARYYDAGTGRFITSDTDLGANLYAPDAFNRYAFNLNDPIDYTDPTGHSSNKKPIKNRLMASGAMLISGVEITGGAILLASAPECPVCAVGGGILISAGTTSGGYAGGGVLTGNFNWDIYGGTTLLGGVIGAIGGVASIDFDAEAVSFTDAEFNESKYDKAGLSALGTLVVLSSAKVIFDYFTHKANSNSNSGSDSESNDSSDSNAKSNEEQQKSAFENNVPLPAPTR